MLKTERARCCMPQVSTSARCLESRLRAFDRKSAIAFPSPAYPPSVQRAQAAPHRNKGAKTCRLCTQMYGRPVNKLGKTEKNAKVMEGPCIFPFKYKRETHNDCIEFPKGRVCATQVNPKTLTLQKYGYCEEYGVPIPKGRTLKKSSSSSRRRTLKKTGTTRTSFDEAWEKVGRSGEVGKEGEVFLVRRRGREGQVYAFKKFKKTKSEAAIAREARFQAAAAEYGAAPKVIEVVQGNPRGIVMDAMEKTLPDVCKAQGGMLTPAQQWGILCAYERMSKSGVLHNDSNPLNMMVDSGGQWRFVDFGMAKAAKKSGPDANLSNGLRFLLNGAKGILKRGLCGSAEILQAAYEQGTYSPKGVGDKPACSAGKLRTSSARKSSATRRTSGAERKLKASFSPGRVHRSQTKKKKTPQQKKEATMQARPPAKKKRLRLVASHKPKRAANRLNEKFIDVLGELQDVMTRKGGKEAAFRAKAYREAADALMIFEGDITPEVLESWVAHKKNRPRHIGPTIVSKLDEYHRTGELKALKKEYARPELELTNIYGVGPKKAEELVSKYGVKSVAALREREDLETILDPVQRVGLENYEDILAKIPRAEIDEYKVEFERVFAASTPPGSEFMIVGSYRRGKLRSGDIDVIVTNSEGKQAAFKDFVSALIDDGVVTNVLSRGTKKCLALARLPGKRARRVDFLWAPPKEYAFAVLYFTGSKIFNTVQRQRALDLGMTLNEHGLYKMVSGKKGERVPGEFPDEQAIFRKLGLVYKAPSERIDARSVVLAADEEPEVEEHAEVQAATQALAAAKEAVAEARKVMRTSKSKTLKKPRSAELAPSTALSTFRKEGAGALEAMTEKELTALLVKANNAYYCDKKPIMSDNEYDIVREHTLARYPENPVALGGHATCKLEIQKNKVTLPFEMWSMDKIKPDTDALARWTEEYKGPYVLSAKLDGVSGMYTTRGGEAKLYTRGNGIVGQDVSHLIPFLQLPKLEPGVAFAIRGEFLLTKAGFAENFADKFANPRNFVAGLVNQKKIEPSKLKHLVFVAYELMPAAVSPGDADPPQNMTPSQQMKALEGMDVRVVQWMETATISNELLSELLVSWRADYEYEIDGIIFANDRVYPRTRGNPAHAKAFKMVLGDQVAEAKVMEVIWTASKHGFLKPRVRIEPVVLGGVVITYATGFNAKFIVDNKIGVGALITIVRSGDVIPHIISVVEPAPMPQMPNVPYHWNETHVDVMVEDKGQDAQVREAGITAFFSKLDTEGVGPGTVKAFIKAGLDTVPKILLATKEDMAKVEGFKKKKIDKVHDGIRSSVDQADLPTLMGATAIFGRGLGRKTFQKALDQDPTVMDPSLSDEERLGRLRAIKGLGAKGAKTVATELPRFYAFAREAGLEDKLKYTAEAKQDTGHALFGKKYVLTGFRDKALVKELTALGAVQASGVSKDVVVVVSPDGEESDTGKADQVRALRAKHPELEIPILTPAEFKVKYGLA